MVFLVFPETLVSLILQKTSMFWGFANAITSSDLLVSMKGHGFVSGFRPKKTAAGDDSTFNNKTLIHQTDHKE